MKNIQPLQYIRKIESSKSGKNAHKTQGLYLIINSCIRNIEPTNFDASVIHKTRQIFAVHYL